MVSQELALAARNLEERFDQLGAPTRRLQRDWLNTDLEVSSLVPSWLRELLATYRIVGGVLEYRDRAHPFVRLFKFLDDAGFRTYLIGESLTKPLPSYGYLPIAEESDGSLWVQKGGLLNGEIFLLDASAWDGGPPTRSNGLTFASSRLDLLLMSMGVSEASYYVGHGLPHSVMWYAKK